MKTYFVSNFLFSTRSILRTALGKELVRMATTTFLYVRFFVVQPQRDSQTSIFFSFFLLPFSPLVPICFGFLPWFLRTLSTLIFLRWFLCLLACWLSSKATGRSMALEKIRFGFSSFDVGKFHKIIISKNSV